MKKIILITLAICTSFSFISAPVFAAEGDKDNCVQTSIIGNGEICDDGKGSSIMHVLELVVDIMTIGIGILGVIGITVVGIQYLTAGGSEEKVRKAKRRMFEIVIGLVAYVVIYAFLRWLLPNFSGINTSQTNDASQSQEVAKLNSDNLR